MTFNWDEAVDAHLRCMRRRGRVEATIEQRKMWTDLLKTFLAGRELTLDTMREWADSLKARGLAPRSVWSGIVNIRAWCNFMEQEGITPTHLARRLERPRLPARLPQALTPEQVNALLDAAAAGTCPERDTAMILFMLETGARRGGAAGLKMGDLDLEKGSARLIEKGDRERIAYFGERVADAMRAWVAVRHPSRFRNTKTNGASAERVFGVQGFAIQRRFEVLGRAAGIPHMHPHLLRHTCATWRVMQGADASTLMQLLGWTSTLMFPVYTTLAGTLLQRQAAKSSPMQELDAQPPKPKPLSQLPREARRLLLRAT
jgi:site-specific recombinase XerD